MIEASEDQAAVDSARSYEVMKSREFAERGVVRPAGCDTEGRPLLDDSSDWQASGPADEGEAAAAVSSLQEPPPPPPDADASFRKARLGVCLCLVLVLAFLWAKQRSARKDRQP